MDPKNWTTMNVIKPGGKKPMGESTWHGSVWIRVRGLKAKVALVAVQGQQTLAELASQVGVHPVQIGRWFPTMPEN